MSMVKPPPFRARIRESEQGLEVEILRRSRWPERLLALIAVVWFAAGWLAFVVGAIVLVVVFLFPGDVPVNGDPIAAAVCLPILVVVMVGYPFLLTRAGWRNFLAAWTDREIMTATAVHWQVEQFIGPWRHARHYATENISSLHQVRRDHRLTLRNSFRMFLHAPGTLAFLQKRARIAFALAATEAEVRQIMRALHRRFPQQCEVEEPASTVQLERQSRWILESLPAELLVHLPVRRNWKTTAVLTFIILYGLTWLTVWTWLVYSAITSANELSTSFISFAAVLASVGGALILWSLRELIWQLRGVEVIGVGEQAIMLSGQHLPLGQPREYKAEHIYALRHEPARYHSWQAPGLFRQPGADGAIAFDYGAGTYRFGQDLTPAEANALVRQILDRFPQYGRDDMIPTMA